MKIFQLFQHMTSMVLGNADNLRVATTFKDFDRKWTKTAKAYPDMGTSIPVSSLTYNWLPLLLANRKSLSVCLIGTCHRFIQSQIFGMHSNGFQTNK